MSGRKWYPADWVDEMCPPDKPRPEDFVVREGDGWVLGYAADEKHIDEEDRKIWNEPLAIGDVVDFISCDDLGEVGAMFNRDGNYVLQGPIPPEHNWVTIDGDMDTFHESFDDLIAAIKGGDTSILDLPMVIFEDGEGAAHVELWFARWSERLPHQFSIEDGKPVFRQVSKN